MEGQAFEAELNGLRLRGVTEAEMRAVREAFQHSGVKGVIRWRLEKIQKDKRSAIHLAMTYVELGEKDQAFEWLEKSWDLPLWGGENAPSNRQLDPLRGDLRFEQLLRKLNLPEEAIQRHLAEPSG